MGEYATPTVSHGISNAFELLFHDDLNRNHTRRLQAYRKYWLFYLGKHWSYARDSGEPTVTVNYTRALLDKHVDFTFKKGFKVAIPDNPATPQNEQEKREFVRHMLESTWEKNQKDLWMMEAGQQGGVTGDVFARVAWDKTDPLEDPYARVDILPSHLCFPELGGPHGVDRKRLTRMLIVIPVFKEKSNVAVSGAFFSRRTKSQEALEMIVQSEEWTPKIVDKEGREKFPARVTYYEDKEVIETKINPLGEIPVVHIPNYPLSGEFYGISDLVDVIELNREYNEKVTDVSDIINYHASPTTVVYGAKLKDLEKGANRMWGLPEGARLENLVLSGDLNASNTHIDRLKKTMLELTGTPEQAFGKSQGISNTPGIALQISYLPMIERRDLKVLTYGYGLRLINRLMLKTTEIADSGFAAKMNKLEGNKYRNKIVFPDPMPYDEAAELEKIRIRLDLAITTRKRELEKLGHSQAEIDAILADVKKEMEEEAEAMFQMEGPSLGPGPGSGNATFQRGGPPELRGRKIDAKIQKKITEGK